MQIINKKPMSLSEVNSHLKDIDETKPIALYLKKFVKLSKDKAEKLADEIRSLNNLKLKEEYILKIVDFLPEDKEDVAKILVEASLSEEELNSILEVVKKHLK